MGIDITAFIDVNPSLTSELETVEWSSIQCFGEIYIERDTNLFALLAGIGGENKPLALIPPRGIPSVSSWQVRYAYTVTAIDDDKWTLGHAESSYPVYCKRSEAEEWIRNDDSKYLNKALSEIIDPDAHTFSWLMVEELEKVRIEYETLENFFAHTLEKLKAIIALMRVFDGEQVGRTRFIFWFKGGKPSEERLINKVIERFAQLKLA